MKDAAVKGATEESLLVSGHFVAHDLAPVAAVLVWLHHRDVSLLVVQHKRLRWSVVVAEKLFQ
jgi:hypothetical protein